MPKTGVFMSIKIMTVDDSRTTREMFVNLLPTLFNDEVEIIEAEDSEEALVHLEEDSDIRIMFLDINMPGLDGDEFIELLKFRPELTKNLKIVIASTESGQDKIEELIEAGASGYVVKPITKTNLTSTLLNLAKEIELNLNVTPIIEENKICKLLIVDDSKTIQKMYQFNLPRLFETTVEIFTASNGQEALDILNKNHDVKLIFLDINMPVMDGFEFLKAFGQIDAIKDIKVIMATTESSKEQQVKMLKAGADGYLTKPFTNESLYKTLKRLQNDFGVIKLKEITALTDKKTIKKDTIKKILIVDDSRTIRQMYINLLPETFAQPIEIIQAEDGKEAIKKLYENSDISIIFLDLNMPIMDGQTALKTIRLNDKYKDIKIVMCTADEQVDHQQALIGSGADGYIIKPFKIEAMNKVIEKLTH